MHKFLKWTILCFFFTCAAVKAGDIYINCGSAGTSTGLDGREWLGDIYPIDFEIQGSSTKSSGVTLPHIGPVPYRTARISSSRFSYIFQVSPGQKFIRLHFNPTSSYQGFIRFSDLFTVEAGPFTLLSNFSASITADALSLNHFTKEYCLSVEENQPLNITFSSQAQDRHAFINGIEIISVPENISYCQSTGNVGVQVIGQKSLVYIENSIALEMVHRQHVKQNFISSGDDFHGMFGIWATVAKEKANRVRNITWRVSVDVGFRYLVRLHFCELGLEKAENGKNNFVLLIDQMVVNINGGIFEKVNDEGGGFFRNYVVMAKGRKQEGKRDILIFLQSKDEFIYGSSPLEGFEIFKLSNPDNSLASPNPLLSKRDLPYWSIQNSLPFLGRKNTIATVVIVVLCMLNIIVHMLQKIWEASFPEEEENKPSIRPTRLCRRFSLAEMRLATKDFNDALFIGRGGFGKVYKGFIDNGQKIVAIKRLKSDSKQGKREFWAEIETLSELRHVNLVSLIGYCDELEEMILVYEYMPNGTLADHLYRLARKNQKYSSLSWEERLNICIGAGRGIDYLHTGNGVIHRDIKSSNILLDETFVAKVSDFGLAKTLNLRDLQSQVSTNFKGTFGYFDPEYFKTQKLTFKSDTYSFGVVLLEVLSGRPAVDPLVEEDNQSLTMWAQNKISRGDVDQIVARSLRGSISPYSLKAFVDIVERCLHNEPKKRPTLAHVIIHLEFVLEQQNTKSLVPSSANIDKNLEENANFLVPNEITNVADILPCTEQEEISASFLPNERASTDPSQFSDKQNLSVRTGPLAMASPSNVQSFSSGMVNAEPQYGKKYGRKTLIHKISQLWKREKPSMKNNSLRMTMFSAPLSHYTSNKTSLSGSTVPRNGKLPRVDGSNGLVLPTPNIRIFSFFELKAATRNFRADTVVGEGGFGRVYKGVLKEISTNKNGNGSFIAIKRLNPESMQGFREWLAEVNYLGRLSHPNLVKLLGYCYEDKELLLVYEFLGKGSLEKLLFTKKSGALPWDIRLKILTGAAHGLAFLHALDVHIIYRDFKTSNMLLDESYNVKLSDFGLAKSGPIGDNSHVSTRVMGTYGYAAPEYVATGHLTTKSDVYSFGVILVEILTGLRALDRNRPSTQHNLVEWIRPQLSQRSKLKKIMDPRLEGGYNPKSASKVLQLAQSCLGNDPKARPSMQEVVEILETIDSSMEKLKETRVRFSNQVLVG